MFKECWRLLTLVAGANGMMRSALSVARAGLPGILFLRDDAIFVIHQTTCDLTGARTGAKIAGIMMRGQHGK